MFTRQQYLDGQCSHSEYYAQFVTPDVYNFVLDYFSHDCICQAYKKDQHFNSISLRKWDGLAFSMRLWLGKQIDMRLTACNDFYSLAGYVCIMKEAARQIATNNPIFCELL